VAIGVAAAVAGAILGVAAGQGSQAKPTTSTVVQNHTDTQFRTKTVRIRRPTKTVTVTHTVAATPPTPAPVPSSSGGGGSGSYSGNGGKNLGTIDVASDSDLNWTHDGAVFQIFDDENAVEVNSQGHSGTSVISAGTYHHFQVNADGNWTIKIAPR
jgi:hypothetical protein